MKTRFTALVFFAALTAAFAVEKPRVLVLTDIENEPDDAMSMVRFLTYTNEWDVEGLVATTSIHQPNRPTHGSPCPRRACCATARCT